MQGGAEGKLSCDAVRTKALAAPMWSSGLEEALHVCPTWGWGYQALGGMWPPVKPNPGAGCVLSSASNLSSWGFVLGPERVWATPYRLHCSLAASRAAVSTSPLGKTGHPTV